MATTSELPVITKYDLTAPCANDVYAAVASLDYRHFTKNWRAICRNAGISHHKNSLSIAELYALSSALTNFGGPISLLGRALDVRTKTYEVMTRIAAADPNAETTELDIEHRALETFERTKFIKADVIKALSEMNIYSVQNRQTLNEYARRASTALSAPIGMVNVILGCAMGSVGIYGPVDWVAQTGGVPVEWSFCTTTLRRNTPYVVPDLTTNVIQKKNPLTKYHGVSAYAGVPVRSKQGLSIGSLCVLSAEARTFDADDVDKLITLAAEASAELSS